MKGHADTRKLALMARVARVREIQAQQALAQVIAQKATQRERVDEAQERADAAYASMHASVSGPAVDLSRLPLLQELSAHVQTALADASELMTQCERQVVAKAGEAGKQSRQRELLDDKTASAINAWRADRETRQLELATDAWLLQQSGGKP